MKLLFLTVCFLFEPTAVWGDIYLHNPRGSNNRLNENTVNRQTNNRLFDSQNNNRGGYNVGDAESEAAGTNADKQYQMHYFQSGVSASSELMIEWTMQHGCGSDELLCDVILQYMCQPENQDANKLRIMRDGTSTDAQVFSEGTEKDTEEQVINREKENVKLDRGLHESWEWYDKCSRRERNRGLFIADVNIGKNKNSTKYTRQNPNGNKNGYECPEERDYYPYWHPTPWKDIVVFPRQLKNCNTIQSESFNAQARHECIEFYGENGNRKTGSVWNNQRDCETNGGRWTALYNYLEKAPHLNTKESCERILDTSTRKPFKWDLTYDGNGKNMECFVPLSPPECQRGPYTRHNHLGNGMDGRATHYTWKLPYFPSEKTQRCIFRIRYNISVLDYMPLKTDWHNNLNEAKGIKSPITKNPQVNIGGITTLQLAINTQQTGRTFQDRSHLFKLIPRPKSLENQKIHNLNVRGKRGNSVQTYPSVEYDFVPNNLAMCSDELVHIQWTGSNTHNNNPAGANGAGQAGTDRHNFLPMKSRGENYPLPFEKSEFWNASTVKWIHHGKTDVAQLDLALDLASAGYYRCASNRTCGTDDNKNYAYNSKPKLDPVLNNAPASYRGVVLKIQNGKYNYMCSRNNNFSNRSQKGTITVSDKSCKREN